MGPVREAERRLVPDRPVLGGRHHFEVDANPGFQAVLLQDLRTVLFIAALGVADDQVDVDAIREAGFGQQLLGHRHVAVAFGQWEVFGVGGRHMVVFAQGAHAAVGDLEHLRVIGTQHHGLADTQVGERL